jgi:uncharacterized protein
MQSQTQIEREVAKRIFAKEFNESDLAYKESNDQYAPTYLLTPTGAKCNRIFVVGTLTDKADVGKDSNYWRARVTDPTGTFLVYAGEYSPEAAQALSDIEVPSFVAVIGKARLFKSQDGSVNCSIRPEAILPVDVETRDRWVREAALETSERLATLKAGTSEDAKKAAEHYKTDFATYKEMALLAAKSLKPLEVVVTDVN